MLYECNLTHYFSLYIFHNSSPIIIDTPMQAFRPKTGINLLKTLKPFIRLTLVLASQININTELYALDISL